MKSTFLTVCFSLLSFLPLGAAASQTAPDELIRKISDKVLHILVTDEALRDGDTRQAIGLVEQVVLPHFNFRRMTMLAVGRDWRNATPAQQQRLTDAFYQLLVRTYSNALTLYRDQTIGVSPLRAQPTDKMVKVQTEIRKTDGQPVTVDYLLEQGSDGWKVFDVVIAGASLVSNYRGTFAQQIHTGGIDRLIDALEAKGRDNAQGSSGRS
jgi:phospholipid transport system substrate-binding protein